MFFTLFVKKMFSGPTAGFKIIHMIESQMFLNQLISQSLCLNQQSHQEPEEDSLTDQQNDFVFDQYLSLPSNNNHGQHSQMSMDQKNPISDDDEYKFYNKTETPEPGMINPTQNQSQQLHTLKQHLATIQTIAMNEIQQLKRQLELQRQEKQSLVQKLQQFKRENGERRLNAQVDESQIISILKQENKMLKQALKKQLHINKNLIKQSINHPSESQTKQYLQQANKQNYPLNQNSESQLIHTPVLKLNPFDRPTIPHPTSQPKRASLR